MGFKMDERMLFFYLLIWSVKTSAFKLENYDYELKDFGPKYPATNTSSSSTQPLSNYFGEDAWSDWSDWADCSRSCDGGVTYQVRRCNSVSGCSGKKIRYQICNMQMRLFVRVEHTARTIRLEANPNGSLKNFIARVKRHEDMSEDHVCAFFFKGQEVRTDYQPPLRLDFLKDRDVVDLKNKTFDVHVETPGGQYISVPVVSSDTIETVKTRIQEASAMQTSSFDLCRHVLRNPDASLSEVVQRNSNLHMALNLASGREAQIFVRLYNGLTRTFRVRLDDSVGHLKLMIVQDGADRSMSLDGMRLVMDDGTCVLREDHRPLSDYGVRDHSALDVWVSLSGD